MHRSDLGADTLAGVDQVYRATSPHGRRRAIGWQRRQHSFDNDRARPDHASTRPMIIDRTRSWRSLEPSSSRRWAKYADCLAEQSRRLPEALGNISPRRAPSTLLRHAVGTTSPLPLSTSALFSHSEAPAPFSLISPTPRRSSPTVDGMLALRARAPAAPHANRPRRKRGMTSVGMATAGSSSTT